MIVVQVDIIAPNDAGTQAYVRAGVVNIVVIISSSNEDSFVVARLFNSNFAVSSFDVLLARRFRTEGFKIINFVCKVRKKVARRMKESEMVVITLAFIMIRVHLNEILGMRLLFYQTSILSQSSMQRDVWSARQAAVSTFVYGCFDTVLQTEIAASTLDYVSSICQIKENAHLKLSLMIFLRRSERRESHGYETINSM